MIDVILHESQPKGRYEVEVVAGMPPELAEEFMDSAQVAGASLSVDTNNLSHGDFAVALDSPDSRRIFQAVASVVGVVELNYLPSLT